MKYVPVNNCALFGLGDSYLFNVPNLFPGVIFIR